MAARFFLRTEDKERCRLDDAERSFIERSGKTTFKNRDELKQFLRTMPGRSTPVFGRLAGSAPLVAASPA